MTHLLTGILLSREQSPLKAALFNLTLTAYDVVIYHFAHQLEHQKKTSLSASIVLFFFNSKGKEKYIKKYK